MRIPSRKVLFNILVAWPDSFDTWASLRAAHGAYGLYRSAATALEKEIALEMGLSIATSPQGAFVDPSVAIPTYLQLCETSKVSLEGTYPRALLVFLDAKEMYDRREVQLLSLSLPYAKRPHQLAMQLTIGRWLAPDSAFNIACIFRQIGFVAALRAALKRGLDGQCLRLTWAPDWKALRTVLNWVGPGDQRACPCCWAPKSHWKQAGYRKGALRRLKDFDTPNMDFLALFSSFLDIVYDPLHCIALVLSHAVLHAIYLWVREHWPTRVPYLLTAFQCVSTLRPYQPPEQEAIGRKDWAMGNNDTKALLKNDKFWDSLANLLPTREQGLEARHWSLDPNDLVRPWQDYLLLVRRMARDLISWNPRDVEVRDAQGEKMHALFEALSLSPRRWTVAVHYFCVHYTPRLRRHGNLQGLCSEGGEHLHQPHARIVERRPSKPRWKCPVGLLACAEWGRRALMLWRHAIRMPCTFFKHRPTLPPQDA